MTASQIGKAISAALHRPVFILQHKGQDGAESLAFIAQEERRGKHVIVAAQPERRGQAVSGDAQLVATMLAEDER